MEYSSVNHSFNYTGGDSGHQDNDAEVQALYPHITLYSSDKCPHLTDRLLHQLDQGTGARVNDVIIYVSNERVRIMNDQGLDYELCNSCLFALNGQNDGSSGGINEVVFIGLNRVVAGLGRVGVGVCSATISWEC